MAEETQQPQLPPPITQERSGLHFIERIIGTIFQPRTSDKEILKPGGVKIEGREHGSASLTPEVMEQVTSMQRLPMATVVTASAPVTPAAAHKSAAGIQV